MICTIAASPDFLLLSLGVSKSGSVRFLHKKINQTDIINFNILKPKPNRNRFKPTDFGSVRFGFCCSKTGKTKKKISMPSVHKLQANLQANLSFCCSRKQICPVPTNYKQISMSSAHKLQANLDFCCSRKHICPQTTSKL